jgi:hypothetical protein
MKNIFKIFNTKNFKTKIKDTISRFPLASIIIVLVSILFFTELHYNDSFIEEINNNIIIAILSLIITFFFSIWVYLTAESKNFKKQKTNLLQIVPILLGIWFFFTFDSNIDNFENITFFLLTLTWILSYIFFSPYLKISEIKKSIFYSYLYKIATLFLISFILWWILYLLWAIWIWAVDTLFSLNINDKKTYWNWAILSLAFITPLFALTQIPEKKSYKKDSYNENKFFSFLIKYIATPFIFIYFLILYAYTIKVLANFHDWPKWEVSWMVIWFSIFGYITYMFSYVFEEKNKFIKIFRKVFPYIVIPQIFMLFYAIYLRINQYDITINRYFIVVFGLWLLIISLYYIFSKKKHLAFIPAVLTLFTIIISIWPWSVYSLPESRQLDRLDKNLTKAWIIKIQEEMYNYTIAKKIIPLKNVSDIEKDLSKNIYDWIDYLCNFDNCNQIKNLFPIIYKEILEKDKKDWEKRKKEDLEKIEENKWKKEGEYHKKYWYAIGYDECYNSKRKKEILKRKYKWPSKWTIVDKITDKIKVERYHYKNHERKYISINIKYHNEIFPINTNWYSNIIYFNSDIHSGRENTTAYAKINLEKQSISIIYSWGKKTDTIYIKDVFDTLQKRYKKTWETKALKKDLTFEVVQNSKKYKIIFSRIDIKNPKYDENKDSNSYSYSKGYLLY